eukprot:4761904-Amphidinium_carterae.1
MEHTCQTRIADNNPCNSDLRVLAKGSQQIRVRSYAGIRRSTTMPMRCNSHSLLQYAECNKNRFALTESDIQSNAKYSTPRITS